MLIAFLMFYAGVVVGAWIWHMIAAEHIEWCGFQKCRKWMESKREAEEQQ